jgi:hypothetical protein
LDDKEPFSVSEMGIGELLSLARDYYSRVLLTSARDTGRWVADHVVFELAIPLVSTIGQLLFLGLPESREDWALLLIPFAAVAVAIAGAFVGYVFLTPARWSHMTDEFVTRWNPLEIDASIGAEPFVCALQSGRYLVLPRLQLFNRDSKHSANLDIELNVSIEGLDFEIRLPPSVVEPDDLVDKMDEFRRGGTFLGDFVEIGPERRQFGYVIAWAPSANLTTETIRRISLSMRDPIRQRAIYRDKLIWPRDEAARAGRS